MLSRSSTVFLFLAVVDSLTLNSACYSASKSFKKKGKGKSDELKLKVRPKKFPKDTKGDNSLGQKRKPNHAADHTKKQFKSKKWKGEEQNEVGNSGLKSQDRIGKGKFGSSKARKRKLHDDAVSKEFAKKRKSSEAGEHDKGKDEK